MENLTILSTPTFSDTHFPHENEIPTLEKKVEQVRKKVKLQKTIPNRLSFNLQAAKKDQKDQTVSLFNDFSTHCVSLDETDLEGISTSLTQIGNREVATASTKGIRKKMEDRHLCQKISLPLGNENISCELFGIFDGHGGVEASTFVAENLPKTLIEEAKNQDAPTRTLDEVIWHTLKETFKIIDQNFKDQCENIKAGTTATVVLILNNRLWVANVGDSRALFVDSEETTQLTVDQKPTTEKYARILLKKGGTIIDFGKKFGVRVIGNKLHLAVARRIGGGAYQGVIPNPTITCYDLKEKTEGHLLLFCDGLLERQWANFNTSSNEIGSAVQQMTKAKKTPEEMAQRLVATALNKFGSEDNISCLVIPIMA